MPSTLHAQANWLPQFALKAARHSTPTTSPFYPHNMRHVAAYLLLATGGNSSPSASDVKELLATVGVEADDARLDKLISELEGKTLSEVIAEGTTKLASVPSGGGGGGAAAPAAGGAAAAAEAPKEEEKKEEEKEESDDDMGFGLFD